jgi:hypothetical protein
MDAERHLSDDVQPRVAAMIAQWLLGGAATVSRCQDT